MYKGQSQKDKQLVFKTKYQLMQVVSIAECSEHSAFLSTFIKLPIVIKIFVLSIFEWPLYTGFTVSHLRNAYMKLEINPVTKTKSVQKCKRMAADGQIRQNRFLK